MQQKETIFGGYDPRPIKDRGNHGGGAGDRRTASQPERCAVSVKYDLARLRWLECGELAVRRVAFNGAAVPMCGAAMKQWIEENPELPLRSVAFVAVWDGDYPGTKRSHVLASGDEHEVTTCLVRAFNEGSAVARQSL